MTKVEGGGVCGIAVAPLGSERRVNVIAERIDRLELLEVWYDEDPTGCDVGYGGSNGGCGFGIGRTVHSPL